jgi:hypothetical protein
MNWAPAMKGVAATTSSEVERLAQTSSGMRQKVIPGARMVMIVTKKLSAVAIEEAPANCTPKVEERLPQRGAGGKRRVAGPAGVEGAARRQVAADEEQPGQRQHPEAERVQPREGHVRRADHQRQHVVGDPGEDRDHEDEDHQHRVRGEEALKVAASTIWVPGCASSAGSASPSAAHEEEEEGGADVLDADHLVIGVEAEVVAPALGAVLGVVVGIVGIPAAQRSQ